MKDIKVLGWDQHLRHILSKKKEIKFFSERDFLNPKGMTLSWQPSVLSFCPFVVLHGQSSHVVMHPQKIMVKTCDNTFITASLVLVWTIYEHFSINTPLYRRSSMEICVYE